VAGDVIAVVAAVAFDGRSLFVLLNAVVSPGRFCGVNMWAFILYRALLPRTPSYLLLMRRSARCAASLHLASHSRRAFFCAIFAVPRLDGTRRAAYAAAFLVCVVAGAFCRRRRLAAACLVAGVDPVTVLKV
jgi:hypothetical protein